MYGFSVARRCTHRAHVLQRAAGHASNSAGPSAGTNDVEGAVPQLVAPLIVIVSQLSILFFKNKYLLYPHVASSHRGRGRAGAVPLLIMPEKDRSEHNRLGLDQFG